ncbi:dicarboxylate/amino acid:cation symporter [Sphingomonas sp. dw_22]|uniref:dicarboxylate/amino acid:cation symporter n=1 Tax=Sphingomonas sp. dw_22 TaxID=2721175 RepID=UPI001BD56622|nr:dicarboxylate/amino acid:cation symporter [Sphingomonas sp. dw_22]
MSQPIRILLALVIGLAVGIVAAAAAPEAALRWTGLAEPIGTAWLNGLRMTIVPLVVGLLVTGIAQTAESARAGKLATRSILFFVAVLWTSSILAAILTPLFLDLWPLNPQAAAALRSSFSSASPAGPVPSIADFFTSLIPVNPLAAAANDAFLPLIVFTTVFGFAVTRLPAAQREVLTSFFRALADAMLIVIGWVLWLAPLGVFALAYVVGARAGTSAFGLLVHYVLIVAGVGAVVWGLAYPLAVFGGRVPLRRFMSATTSAQAVAISTQSSLASLPAMLRGCERLDVPVATSGVVLPLAVALFRATGPAMNLAVAIYVAHIFGMHLGPAQMAAGIAAGAITTMGAVSLPGSISYVSSIAPIAIAMGVPIEPLALLVAVETLPDIVRTLGNVTMDVAVTATIAERSGVRGERSEADDLLEAEG